MSSRNSSSTWCRLTALLALLGWVGFGASACLCAHGAPSAAPVDSAMPSCHDAVPAHEALGNPSLGNPTLGSPSIGDAMLSSTCCQHGQPASSVVTLDWRAPRMDPPASPKCPASAVRLGSSLELALRHGNAAPLAPSPPHAPPPAFVLPLRI